MSDLDLLLPNLGAASDDALTTVGPCYDLNAAARLVRVGVRGEPLWLPAMPGRYRQFDSAGAGLARVLLNPSTGRPALVLGPLDPVDPVVPATMTATAATTATVTWAGTSYSLPYLAGAYGALPAPVWISLSDWGTPMLVHGPSAIAPSPSGGGGTAPEPPATIQVEQTINPQWSGSWRDGRGWDRWNVDRYGGRSTLYQGNDFGSGPMKGLATYGDQLVNLGAISIDAIAVNVEAVTGSGAAVVQGSPHGGPPTGAPVSSGDTASTGALGTGGRGAAFLSPTTREGMRTGAVRGLALVGASYLGVRGTPDGMSITVLYTRPA